MTGVGVSRKKIITEARDMALKWGKWYVGSQTEMRFLGIAQKLDEILRPALIQKLRKGR